MVARASVREVVSVTSWIRCAIDLRAAGGDLASDMREAPVLTAAAAPHRSGGFDEYRLDEPGPVLLQVVEVRVELRLEVRNVHLQADRGQGLGRQRAHELG